VEEARKNMAHTQGECIGIVNDKITMQVLDTLKEKTMQAQMQATKLTKKFQVIAGETNGAHQV
jgi:uncharacterized protein YlxP (DUF503 family)